MSRPWSMFGPYSIDKHSSNSWKDLFRAEVSVIPGLVDAAGVYIIGSKLRGRERIRYVGMTHWQGFELEIFSQRNMSLIWDSLCIEKNSEINIWLVAKRKPKLKGFSWNKKMENEAFLLETLFIMHAKAAGHNLINTSKMKSADGIAVEGLFGKRLRGRKPSGLERMNRLLAL